MCLTQKSVKHMWSPEASGAHVAVCLLLKSGGGGKAQRRRGFWGGYDWNSLVLVFYWRKMPEASKPRVKTGNWLLICSRVQSWTSGLSWRPSGGRRAVRFMCAM